MTRQDFSYYLRKKFDNRFTQGEFFQPHEFLKFLEKHNIRIREDQLERFEREEWLWPAFRINLTEELQKKGLMLNMDGIKAFYKDGFIEFPKKGDYQPWSNFRHDYKKGEMHDKKLMYYHSFQLLQVQNIIHQKKFSFTYYDSYSDEDVGKVLQNIKKSRDIGKKSFHDNLLSKPETIGFLMLLEEPYRYQTFGHFSVPWFRKGDGFKSWVNWRRGKFDAEKLRKYCGLSIDQVQKIYEQFAIRGHSQDPLEKWYDLTRIMRKSVLEDLQGEPLTAQLYYNIARMIALFIYDLNKEKMDEPDIIFDGMHGEWKKNIYSNPFDYGSQKTQRGIIRYFIRDITTRLFLLVEGETEEKIVKKIFEKLSIDSEDDSISIFNYDGISNLTPKKLKSIIQTANKDNVAIFIIADNEDNAQNKIETIRKLVLSEFEFHVWNESFESDNFGKKKVIKLVNSYLKKHNEKLSVKAISKQMRTGKTLTRAIEMVYSSKYHDNLYRNVPRKPNLSLEMMNSRLKQISREKKVGKPLPIENVLERVFQMVPYWG